MKKLLSLLIALVIICSLTIPAMAASETDVTTQTTVTSSGTAPVVIAKWEQLPASPWDNDLVKAGFQIDPSCTYQIDVNYQIWAIVWDAQGVGSINEVYADVYHPDYNVSAPYDQNSDLNGQFKYQVRLGSDGDLDTPVTPVARAEALAQYDAILALGNITFDGIPEEIRNLTTSTDQAVDVREAILQDIAWLVFGNANLSYHQPAGLYTVNVNAIDSGNAWSAVLTNTFEYVPMTCVAFDNTKVFYNNTEVGTHRWAAGDYDFTLDDYNMTVRNLGNTWAQILVKENDMLFGQTLIPPSTYEWNVKYDARLTENGTILNYLPALAGDAQPADFIALAAKPFETIPGVLKLCNTLKLDFSIEVLKAPPAQYKGAMILGAEYEPFADAVPTLP